MKRRKFLRRGLESAVLLYCAVELPIVHAAEPRRDTKSPRGLLAALPAFLDTLIPADRTPSATQLGLEQALRRHAQGIENYPRLLELGCGWLDQTAVKLHGVSFELLKPAQREAVVTLAEASPENSIARILFERVRLDLLGLYYATPASWEGLGISSAPQPKGYLDYTRAPRRSTRG